MVLYLFGFNVGELTFDIADKRVLMLWLILLPLSAGLPIRARLREFLCTPSRQRERLERA